MSGTAFVNDDGGIGVVARQVSDSACVIQVNVRDHYGCKVVRTDAEMLERLDDDGCRARGPSLDQGRT